MPLDKNTTLIKTELGREAIARRLPELPARLRPVLIMMDGKRTLAELAKLAELMGGQAAIEQLLALNLARVVPASGRADLSAAPIASVDVPLEAADENSLTLAQFTEQLAHYFETELGPSAQMLAIHIRACQKANDLKPLIARGLDNLQHFKGLAAVKAFQKGLGSQLPRN